MRIQLDRGCGYFDRTCVLCGGFFETHAVQAFVHAEQVGSRGVVCPDCVKAGPEGIRDRIRHHTETLREWAELYDRLATERIEVPTFEEWERQIRLFDEALALEYQAG